MLPFPISFFLSLLVNAFLRLHLVLPHFSSGIRFASLFPVQFTIFIFQKSLLCSIENTFTLCASYVWHRSYYLLRLREWSEVLEIENYYWKSSPKPLSLYVMSLNAVGCRWSGWSRWCQRFLDFGNAASLFFLSPYRRGDESWRYTLSAYNRLVNHWVNIWSFRRQCDQRRTSVEKKSDWIIYEP